MTKENEELYMKCLNLIYGKTNKRRFTGSLSVLIGETFQTNAQLSWYIVRYLKDHKLLLTIDGSTSRNPIFVWNDEKTEPNPLLASALYDEYCIYRKIMSEQRKENMKDEGKQKERKPYHRKNTAETKEAIAILPSHPTKNNTTDINLENKRNWIAKMLSVQAIQTEYYYRLSIGEILLPVVQECTNDTEVEIQAENNLSEVAKANLDDDAILNGILHADDQLLVSVLRDRGWDVKVSKTVVM